LSPVPQESIELVKTDPSRNQRRIYRIALRGDFFDAVVLVREWGRLGQRGGQQRCEPFPDLATARAAMERLVREKMRRGYRPRW
jgi:predicted DNA-binding WGR domain protein